VKGSKTGGQQRRVDAMPLVADRSWTTLPGSTATLISSLPLSGV